MPQGTWQDRGNGELWLDHLTLRPQDLEQLQVIRWLTAWNVKFPEGFLAQLPDLEWLDIRGGSRSDLSLVTGCTNYEASS